MRRQWARQRSLIQSSVARWTCSQGPLPLAQVPFLPQNRAPSLKVVNAEGREVLAAALRKFTSRSGRRRVVTHGNSPEIEDGRAVGALAVHATRQQQLPPLRALISSGLGKGGRGLRREKENSMQAAAAARLSNRRAGVVMRRAPHAAAARSLQAPKCVRRKCQNYFH